MSFHVPNHYRIKTGAGSYNSDDSDENNGAFYIPTPHFHKPLLVIASDGLGWEHVSVSLETRCPNWDEMCLLKDLFWDSEDIVIQIHPPKSKYINQHPYCLHLWRPINAQILIPDQILVGSK